MIFYVFQKNWVFGYSWSTLLWYRCYYPHRSRDALSPVCGIFLVCFLTLGHQLPPPAGKTLVLPVIFLINLQGGNDGAREVIWTFNGTILLSAFGKLDNKKKHQHLALMVLAKLVIIHFCDCDLGDLFVVKMVVPWLRIARPGRQTQDT